MFVYPVCFRFIFGFDIFVFASFANGCWLELQVLVIKLLLTQDLRFVVKLYDRLFRVIDNKCHPRRKLGKTPVDGNVCMKMGCPSLMPRHQCLG